MKTRATTVLAGLVLGIAAAVGICEATAPAADLSLPQLWSVNLNTLLEMAAIVADVNGDGREETVVAGREDIFVLDGQGKELWHWRASGRFLTYPTVWSRKGQPALIFAADNSSTFNCLDGTGKVAWQAKLSAPVLWSASVLCNLDADATPEVIQTDDKGAVWAFNAEDGSQLWQAAVKGTPVTPAVDGDGRIYVATGAGLLFALASDGKVLWERPLGGTTPSWATAAPIAFAKTAGLRVAVPTGDGRLMAFDGDGNVLWERPTRGPASSALSAADFDDDGVMDIFLITHMGGIHRFDETGRTLWDIDMQGRTLAPGAIVDLNGDGKLEYVLSTQSGNLMAFDQNGKVIANIQFNNRTINATPAFADLSPDSPGLELVVTGGESGRVFCLGTPAPANAAAPWRMYRADATNAGQAGGAAEQAVAATRMHPRNLAWDALCSGEEVVFDVAKAADDRKTVKASATCVRPNGSRQVAMARILRKQGTLRLPVQVNVPGVYRFEWNVIDDAGQELASGARELTLQPFANDRALVAHALDVLKAAAGSASPASAAALRREAVLLAADAEVARSLQDKAGAGDAQAEALAVDESAKVVRHARRAIRIAELAANPTATGLILSEGDPWESRGIGDSLPAEANANLTFERRVVPGEHEPVAINLFNTTDRALLVKVAAKTPAEGPKVTLHRAVAVPTAQGNMAWDVLPKLDEASLVTIAPLTTEQVWVDSDFTSAKTGDCAAQIVFRVLNGPGVVDGPTGLQDVPAPEATADLKFKVLPFESAPSGVFRLCAWASLGEEEIADQLAHGGNVFCVPLPVVQRDAQGNITKSDFTNTDALLKHLRGHDVMVLLTHLPALNGAPGNPEYAKEIKPYLDELVAHMAEFGFDTQHFALYPYDEPGGFGWTVVNQLVAFATAVKTARPDVLMYVDGGGEGPMFEAMYPCLDIWTPSIYQLPEDSAEMRIMRRPGKTLWSYNCSYFYARPAGPNIKDINVVAEFRNAALFCLRYGATGMGFWCYNIGTDPWGRVKDEYMLVYPGASGPVTTRRWEAVREGIEEYRMLKALKDGQNFSDDARAKVARIFDATIPSIIDPSYEEVRQGFSREAIDAGNNTAIVEAFRKEIMDTVEAALAK